MGDANPAQINAIVTTGASTTVGILTALTVLTPGVGAAIAGGIAVASLIVSMFKGCGAKCIIASQDADKFEAPLKQNLAAYMAAPVHYASLQRAFLNNVDTLFAALNQACSDPALGDPGRRCISERLDRTACHWKNSGGNTPSGSGNVCWNWVVGYRDPIANDPSVVPDPSPIQQAGSSVLQSFGLSPSTSVFGLSLSDLLLPGLLIGAALLLPSGKR
jgi:hypothetical protein